MISILLILFIAFPLSNGAANPFNLQGLSGGIDDPISGDKKTLENVLYTIKLDQQVEEDLEAEKQDTDTLIKHMILRENKDAQAQRRKPQWVSSYYNGAIIVYVRGTTSEWDWNNLIDLVPRKIDISGHDYLVKHPPQGQVQFPFNPIYIHVHNGMYNAINNHDFVEELYNDITTLITNKKHDVKQMIFAGHSQGGGIVTLLMILWRAKCYTNFRDSFDTKTALSKNPKIKGITDLMDNMIVYTFGGAAVVGHGEGPIVDATYGEYLRNFIHPLDPAPMLLDGNNKKPEKPLKLASGLTGFKINKQAQALMDEHGSAAWLAPFGQYIVILPVGNTGKYAFKRLRRGNKLYKEHLIEGANTFLAYNANPESETPSQNMAVWIGEIRKLLLMANYHVYLQYHKFLTETIPIYIAAIQQHNVQSIDNNAYQEYQNVYQDEDTYYVDFNIKTEEHDHMGNNGYVFIFIGISMVLLCFIIIVSSNILMCILCYIFGVSHDDTTDSKIDVMIIK